MSKIFAICLAAGIAAAALAEETVEVRATGLWSVAGETFTIEAKATSPDDSDLSDFHWCLCDASGSVVMSWKKRSVAGKAKRLKANLPAGTYRLRATDGTRFCGDMPVRVLPRENPYARTLLPVEIHEPPDPKAPSGPVRFWRDLQRKEFSQAPEQQRTPRRVVARLCASYPEHVQDLADLVDRTAAGMKSVGENALVCPAEWDGMPDHLSAWYARFDVEGLKVFPMLELGMDAASSRSARHELQRRIDGIVGVGKLHTSFGGICIRVARKDALDAKELAHMKHFLSEYYHEATGVSLPRSADTRRSGALAALTVNAQDALWVVDDSDLAELANPLRAGDAVSLAARGEFGNAARPGVRTSFIQAFRALPAVMFNDEGTPSADGVHLRQATYEGMSWFYVVNTGALPARVKLEVPSRTRDLAKDARVGGLFGAETLAFTLGPGEMRAYAVPEANGKCKLENGK